jgi:hypothetical protein
MATHVVGGVMGYSGGEEAGDDVVMGAGPPPFSRVRTSAESGERSTRQGTRHAARP